MQQRKSLSLSLSLKNTYFHSNSLSCSLSFSSNFSIPKSISFFIFPLAISHPLSFCHRFSFISSFLCLYPSLSHTRVLSLSHTHNHYPLSLSLSCLSSLFCSVCPSVIGSFLFHYLEGSVFLFIYCELS